MKTVIKYTLILIVGMLIGMILTIYLQIGWIDYGATQVCFKVDTSFEFSKRPESSYVGSVGETKLFCLPDSYRHPNLLAPWWTRNM